MCFESVLPLNILYITLSIMYINIFIELKKRKKINLLKTTNLLS